MKTVHISDLGDIKTGSTPSKKNPDNYGDYALWIKPTDINPDEKYTRVVEEMFSEKAANDCRTRLIPAHSICVPCIGTVGTKLTMTPCDCFVNQSINAVIPNKDYDNDYIYYLLLNFLPNLKSINKGTASGREYIAKSAFENIEIKVHSDINVQRKIGRILSAYDDIIENCKQQISLLEEATQRLYREWFVDLRFPGYETTPVGENGLPEGWNYGTINKLGTFKRGKNILTKDAHGGPVPVIAGGLKPSCYHDKFNTSAPVMTVSGSGANAGYASIFTTPVWASDCSYLDSNSSTSIYYIYCFLKNNPLILLSRQKGSAQPHVYARDINDTKILIPRNKHLSDFCNVSQFYFNEIGNLLQLKNNALIARDLLLPNLISGQIEIIV